MYVGILADLPPVFACIYNYVQEYMYPRARRAHMIHIWAILISGQIIRAKLERLTPFPNQSVLSQTLFHYTALCPNTNSIY